MFENSNATQPSGRLGSGDHFPAGHTMSRTPTCPLSDGWWLVAWTLYLAATRGGRVVAGQGRGGGLQRDHVTLSARPGRLAPSRWLVTPPNHQVLVLRRLGEVSASPPPSMAAWMSGEEARRLGEPRGGLGEFVSSGTGVYLVRGRG